MMMMKKKKKKMRDTPKGRVQLLLIEAQPKEQ
jgi:hypothetical protein